MTTISDHQVSFLVPLNGAIVFGALIKIVLFSFLLVRMPTVLYQLERRRKSEMVFPVRSLALFWTAPFRFMVTEVTVMIVVSVVSRGDRGDRVETCD